MMSKSILVTGCLGYIGSVLTRELLARDYDVVGVDNCRYNNGDVLGGLLSCSNFEFLKHDVRDHGLAYLDYIKNVDVVILLAAMVGAPVCDANQNETRATNVSAMKYLTDHLRPHQHIIYPNTNSGYGQTNGTSFCTEKDELKPISLYATTKCKGEDLTLLCDAKSTVFRLATVFGASQRMRMDLMVNDFTRRLTYLNRYRRQNGVTTGEDGFQVFDPHFKRNFVHVLDVARAFIFAIENRLSGIYNLGLPSANLTKLELAYFICDAIGLSKDVVSIGQGTDPDQRNYIVSNEKLLRAGFKFKNDLEKGVEEVSTICSVLDEYKTGQMRNA